MTDVSSPFDFGESIIPLTGTDAFFLDTNIIIAYLYDRHEKHIPCFNTISYLMKNDVILCVSEIVVVESINTLARILYIEESLHKYIEKHGSPTSNKERRNLEYRFKCNWSSSVIKNEPENLMHYNRLASNMIQPFIEGTLLIECNQLIVEDTINLLTNSPIASADAMIISTVINFGCQYLLSIDRDMRNVAAVTVLTTDLKNDHSDWLYMLQNLDIIDYLFDKLGEMEIKVKFPGLLSA